VSKADRNTPEPDRPAPPRQLSRRGLLAGAGLLAASACTSRPEARPGTAAATGGPSATAPPRHPTHTNPRPSPARTAGEPDSTATVAARATVPVLCYHQLRTWRPTDGGYARRWLICPPRQFRAHLDALQAADFSAISPDQYLDHLTAGAALPPRPVLLSFDDAQGSQRDVAAPELIRRGLTGTFFIMTVVLDKPDWLSSTDLQRFASSGMTIAAHTWDHHRVDRYAGPDWARQLQQPREQLEGLLHAPVEHFAYPYGAWNPAALEHVRAAGYRSAYQLSDHPLDSHDPLHTLRRVLIDSTWTGTQLLTELDAGARAR